MSFKSEDRGSTYYISIPPHWLFPITDYIYRKHTFIDTYAHSYTFAWRWKYFLNPSKSINLVWKSNCLVVNARFIVSIFYRFQILFAIYTAISFLCVAFHFFLHSYRILLHSIICRCRIQFVEVSVCRVILRMWNNFTNAIRLWKCSLLARNYVTLIFLPRTITLVVVCSLTKMW